MSQARSLMPASEAISEATLMTPLARATWSWRSAPAGSIADSMSAAMRSDRGSPRGLALQMSGKRLAIAESIGSLRLLPVDRDAAEGFVDDETRTRGVQAVTGVADSHPERWLSRVVAAAAVPGVDEADYPAGEPVAGLAVAAGTDLPVVAES